MLARFKQRAAIGILLLLLVRLLSWAQERDARDHNYPHHERSA